MTDKQHHSDLDRVSRQNSFTDFARGVEERPRGGGLLENLVLDPVRSVVEATPYGKAVRGRTNFENHDLNQMLDLVEQTAPEDLESSGKALWDARDAIKSAAEELAGHIDNVRWVGEAGEAFRSWGHELVMSTHQLSDFAGGAGDQITAAAVGLASVRKAMPPRDTRPSHEQKQPHAFPKPEQVDSNSDYAAAVRVEKHRQEAINQMNRLSSYYSVSAEQLKGLQTSAPEFKNMPNVGVPQPVTPAPAPHTGGHSATNTPTGTTPHGTPVHHTSIAPADPAVGNRPVDTGGHTRTPHVLAVDTPHPDVPDTVDTGTNIDSVGTLPPPTTSPQLVTTPPVTGGTAPNGGPTGMFEGGLGLPLPSSTSQGVSGRTGGFRTPASSQGRIGTSGPSASGSGRSPAQGPGNQMGRATSTGQSMGKATQAGARSSSSPMGRGVTGGTPRAGGTAGQRAAGGPTTGAGRGNGVVGGRPTATGGSAKGSGSRLPRGTVIGVEGATGSRSQTGSPAGRSVFGAPESTQRPGTGRGTSAARGGAAPAEGVSGRPAARTSAVRAERNGMTRGGAGLVRGSGNRKKREGQRDAQDAPRPDHEVEENETTHPPAEPRPDVPPVGH
ncbi:hypothetical protein AB0P32_26130 [Streptomyces sp. NPDC085995]|uniref:hypothetical protein n=1 Tax=Streptomyces sp. NPDC085995 TaxID=3154861 RepID=UPI00341EC96D